MPVREQTEPVDIPRELWAQTVERMRTASRVRYGVALSALEPCELCGVEVIGREDLTDGGRGARDVVEVLALQYKTDTDGVRGIAGWTSPHRCGQPPGPLVATHGITRGLGS